MKKTILILIVLLTLKSPLLSQSYELWGWGGTPAKIGSDTNWKSISSGYYNTFAIKNDGTLWAWGKNGSGQLGTGDSLDRYSPTKIGTNTNWKSIAVSSGHSIAIKNDGTLWTWGWNDYGQLGDGTKTNKSNPTQLGAGTNWQSIAAGNGYSIAIKKDGTLWSWGGNFYGQLGDGTNTDKYTPTQIGLEKNWKTISAGNYHVLAIKSDGTLWSWGYNNSGQLGIGSSSYKSNTPTQIGSSTNWQSISAGYEHSIAIKSDGTLWAWGFNGGGILGDGLNSNLNTPKQIGTETNWQSISAGMYYTLALKNEGTLWACGYNSSGQLGDGTNTDKITFTQIGSDTIWKSIASGGNYSIALKVPTPTFSLSGFIKDNLNQAVSNISINLAGTSTSSTQSIFDGSYSFSNLVDGSYTITPQATSSYTFSPVSITINISGASISSGLDFTAVPLPKYSLSGFIKDSQNQPVANISLNLSGASAVTTQTKADGSYSFSNLVDGNYNITPQATNYYNFTPISKNIKISGANISSGLDFTAVVLPQNTNEGYELWAWGENGSGQLGDGTNTSNIPIKIGVDTTWTNIISGWACNLAQKKGGTLWAWGDNSQGQLGIEDFVNRNSPFQIGNEVNWTQINSCNGNSAGIKSDGTLWAWGLNQYGQLGTGDIMNRNIPTQIGFDSDWKSIYLGLFTSFAIKNDGTLWAWGYNSYGQIGDGTNISKNIPTKISNGNDWKFISSGVHTIAIKTDGTLWAWGFNENGQLGTGTNINKDVPIQIGIENNWSSIATGRDHTIALKTDGTLWAWGVNDKGQLGTGVTNTFNNAPSQIGTDTDWKYISAGGAHSVAIKNNGTLWTWGDNQNGQSGNRTLINYLVPTKINSDTSWKAISAGAYHILALKSVSKFKVRGTVKENGLGVNNYTVYMTGNSKTYTAQTIADGSYTLLVGTGTYKIFVDTTSKISTPSKYNFVNISKDTSNFDFALSDKINYTISGKIIDLEKNAELPNVSIVMSGKASGTYTTNITGDYSIPVANGSYTITPILDGFTFVPSSATIDILDLSKAQNFTAVADKYIVSGYLKENTGTNLPNFNVYLSNGSSTQSDINGYYLFNLRKGNYTIKPDVSTFKSSPDSIDVLVFKADLPNNNFILTRPTSTYNISGDVVNSSGIGIANVEIILSSKIVKTDANGKFSFNNIAEGKHVIVPSSNEYYFEPTYLEINLSSNINNIKFIAIRLTELPNCIISRDTTLPSVYAFDPYLASKRGHIEVKNDCLEAYTITDIALSGNTNQFKIVGLNELLPIVIPSYSSVNIPIEFKPTKAGLDSVYIRLIFGQKQMAVKVKSEGVDAGPGLPYTVLTMHTKPESAKPGERVELYLLVPKTGNYTLTTNDYYEAEYTIKTQLEADLDTISTPNITKFARDGKTGDFYPGPSNPNGYTTVRFQGRYIPQYKGVPPWNIDTLAKFRFIATLGNQDSTNIVINEFRWLSGGAKAEVYNDGIFRIIPCEAGGERLIGWRSQSKVTLLSIAPNPTSDNISLRINSTDELENSEIEVFNVLGISLIKSNFIITKGDSELKLDLKNIPNGFYTIRLNTKPPQSPLEQVGGNVQSVFFKQ